jgi:hypothetical protein
VRTFHYGDDSDSPTWVSESSNGLSWTRNVRGVDGDLVAVQDSAAGITLQLADLHYDVVATATPSATALGTSAKFETDEFGVPRATSTRRYQ